MVTRKPPSIYDYWQALSIVEEEVKKAKEEAIRPTSDYWQFLIGMEEWLRSQKDRIVTHVSRYSKFAERLLRALDKVMD